MTRNAWGLGVTLVAAAAVLMGAGHGAGNAPTTARAVTHATGSPGPSRDRAIASLRAMGPPGLAALLTASPLRSMKPGIEPSRVERAEAARFLDAVDRVAAQRDAVASRLYWYTDLGAAKAEAARTGRPVLSLRLLGRLDEDLSCANSRFFRTVLYANELVSRELSSRFVLHWESVRPVPKLTIDFGDGRKVVTTITGNSIHYVLLPDGRPIDAMPGLWGSQAFLAELRRAEQLTTELQELPHDRREQRLKRWHAERLRSLSDELRHDAESLPPSLRDALLARADEREATAGGVMDDVAATPRTFTTFPVVSKFAAEMPVVTALVPGTKAMRGEVSDEVWSALAALHADECALDESSRDLARRKELGLSVLGYDAPRGDERNLEPMFEKLQRSVAEDTVRSRFMTSARISEWFVSGTAPADVKALNERVYRELFLSPVNDAWLGLVPPDTYTGLDAGGRSRGAS